jgi:hypothetical protein
MYRSTNTDGWQLSGCNQLIDRCAAYPKRLCYLSYAQKEPLWCTFLRILVGYPFPCRGYLFQRTCLRSASKFRAERMASLGSSLGIDDESLSSAGAEDCAGYFLVMQVHQSGWHRAKDLEVPEHIRSIFPSLEELIETLCQTLTALPEEKDRLRSGMFFPHFRMESWNAAWNNLSGKQNRHLLFGISFLMGQTRFTAPCSHAISLALAAKNVKCGLIRENAIGSSDSKLLPVGALRNGGGQAPAI